MLDKIIKNIKEAKLNKTVFTTIVILLASLSGCATIAKGSKGNVYFLNPPKDLKVYDGSTELHGERKEANELYDVKTSFMDETSGRGGELTGVETKTKTTKYAYGITLPDSSKPYTLTLESNGEQATVEIEPRIAMRWFWLDLFSGGLLVDPFTGAWKELAPKGGELNRVDVDKYLK